MKTLTAPTAALVAALLGGCAESSMVARTRWQIESGLPGASFERSHGMHFGRISTALLKPLAHWALRGEDDDRAMLRGIRRVEFAVYEVRTPPSRLDAGTLTGVERRLGAGGWGRTLRTREADEITWVFNRENDAGEIRDLFVVSMDETEMVMVRVSGRIDVLLAEMIADDPSGFGASLGG